MLAYNHHLPLRLSPDVVWLTIVQSVAKFIEDSGETYRDTLVLHAVGKMMLTVHVPAEWERSDALIEWDAVLDAIRSLIATHARPDVAEAFSPAFTTTTLVSTTAATVCLMSALQTFFDMSMTTSCGIGEVYMDGTVEDWVQLQNRTRALAVTLGPVGVDLLLWFTRLDGTLGQLLATAQRRPDTSFWQHAYSAKVIRDSGAGTYLSGWFSHFFCAAKGALRESIEINETPAGFVHVPFKWDLLSGKTRVFTLQAGTWTAQVSALGVVSATPQWKATESGIPGAAAIAMPRAIVEENTGVRMATPEYWQAHRRGNDVTTGTIVPPPGGVPGWDF
jgi:hypothetical protein